MGLYLRLLDHDTEYRDVILRHQGVKAVASLLGSMDVDVAATAMTTVKYFVHEMPRSRT